MKRWNDGLAACVCLLLLMAAAPARRPSHKGKLPSRAAPKKPVPPDSARAAPAAQDSVAMSWVDSASAATGGTQAWFELKNLSYTLRVTQKGARDASRDADSRRALHLFPGGSWLRIDTHLANGHTASMACAGSRAWYRENDTPRDNEVATRYVCQQRELDELLLSLPRRLALDREDVHRAGIEEMEGWHLLFLDLDPGPDGNLWRIGLDPKTYRPAVAMWWHFARGEVPPEGRLIPSEYSRVGPLHVPMRWTLWSGDGRHVMNEYRLGDVRSDESLQDSYFTGP